MDRRLVDLLEENNRQRYLVRRQAARRRGAGKTSVVADTPHRAIGHSPSVRRSSPRHAPAVRVAGPMPRLFLSSLLLLGVGFFCVALVIYRALFGGS